jgi:protein-S-isoprenylcysteine O-methyltransferase Ste14
MRAWQNAAMKKPLPPTYLLSALVLMTALHLLLPVRHVIGWPVGLVGAVPLACGIALNLLADRAFTRSGTTVKPFERSTALLTTGPFRLSRHPMCLGFVLILLGLALLAGSLSPFAVVIVFPLLMERLFIRVEERMLEEQFGRQWREYRATVRRWI